MNDNTSSEEKEAKHKKWLETYEPVLRFSAGENYFPMDVERYIENCRVMVHVKDTNLLEKIKRLFKYDFKKVDNNTNLSPSEKIEQLPDYGSNAYLQFVPRRPVIIQNLVLFVFMLIHVVVIGWGMHPNNFAAIGPALFTPGDYIKVVILGVLLVLWPFLQWNRKMSFAIVLNLFAAFFFGTLQGVGFGLLALTFLAGMLAIFITTWVSLTLDEWAETNLKELTPYSRLEEPFTESQRIHYMIQYIKIILLVIVRLCGSSIIKLLSIPLLLGFTGFGAFILFQLLATLNLVSTDVIPLETRFGVIHILPRNASIAVIVGAVVLLLFWFWSAEAFDNRIRIWNQKLSPKEFRPPLAEFKMLFVMGVSSVLLLFTCLLGYWLGLFTEGSGRSWVWLIVILEAAIAGFWLFMHPLTPRKPDSWLDENGERGQILGWNGYALLVIIIGTIAWWIGSLLDFFRIYEIPFLFFIVNVVVTILVSGSELAKFFIDLLSRQLDSDADRAKVRYQRILSDLDANEKRFVYYGRVCEKGNWVVLQYHYFYAFNDWRRTANGLNHHEGDWEAVSVYLERVSSRDNTEIKYLLKPFGVAYSQHHDGVFCFWDHLDHSQTKESDPSERIVRKAISDTNNEPKPLVYVALGSHANYPWPDLYKSSTFFRGFLQNIIACVDKFLAKFQPAVRVREPVDFQEWGRRIEDHWATVTRGTLR